jgi:mitochondrial fission protein ELM1
LFDLCLAPEHDLTGRRHGSNVIATVGALHRVVPPPTGPRPGGLILVGGPSAQHGFAGGDLLENIRLIVAAGPDLDWRLTDSRRTPPEWLESMAAAGCPVRCFSWRETPPGWVGAGLAVSRDVWVTEDSVSMICEALGAGARVGVLPMPRTKPRSRVVHGIQSLLDRGYANSLAEWRETGGLRPPREILLEADRCARLVLERLFPKRLSGL